MILFKRLNAGLLVCLIILLSLSDVYGSTVKLSWKPPLINADGSLITDLAGYRVYYGTAPRTYSHYIDVGNVTAYQISNLAEGLTYYFATTSFDTSGNESLYSGEINKFIPSPLNTSFTISARAGINGSVLPYGYTTVQSGAARTYTITANPGYYVSSVIVDGVNKGPLASYTFSNVTSNHTISAYFQAVTHSITASAGAGGIISPSGTVAVANGSGRTFSIIPDAGYHIEDVLVDGSPAGPVTSYTFAAVTASHTISAVFAVTPSYTMSESQVNAAEYFGSGTDGAITISGAKNINTDAIASGRTYGQPDGYSVNVVNLFSNSAVIEDYRPAAYGRLAAGDKVLLINLQGTSLNYGNAGTYEILTVDHIVDSYNGNYAQVYFTSGKTKYYGDGVSNDTNIGIFATNQRVILQRVPQYTNVTIQSGGSLTANAWNGTKGGILAFFATGTVTVNSGGSVTMSARGYRSQSSSDVAQGESYNMSGSVTYAFANLGGGGADYWVDPIDGWEYAWEDVYAGGGYGTGGAGASGDYVTAYGGGTYGNANITKLFMGSAGGNYNSNINGGGGIIFIRAGNLAVSGRISNDGTSSLNCTNLAAGGAGGSIYLSGSTLPSDMGLVTAQGGAGGYCPSIVFGAGGSGRILLNHAVPN